MNFAFALDFLLFMVMFCFYLSDIMNNQEKVKLLRRVLSRMDDWIEDIAINLLYTQPLSRWDKLRYQGKLADEEAEDCKLIKERIDSLE